MSYFPVLENTTSLMSKTTVSRFGWSWHSERIFWRGILESHRAVIICNESIVDRVSFLGTVDIFQKALCLSELNVWLSYAVTLHWLSRYGSPSNELMFHPVSYHSSAVPQDAQSTKTHAAARVHGNNRNKHENIVRNTTSQHTACSVISVQLTWQPPALRNLPGWDIKSLHFQ